MNLASTTILPPENDRATWNALLTDNPTFLSPVRDNSDQNERRWDGEAFEIIGLAFRLGDKCYCGVESGKSCQSAADEPRKTNGVKISTQPYDESQQGRRNTKRNLLDMSEGKRSV